MKRPWPDGLWIFLNLALLYLTAQWTMTVIYQVHGGAANTDGTPYEWAFPVVIALGLFLAVPTARGVENRRAYVRGLVIAYPVVVAVAVVCFRLVLHRWIPPYLYPDLVPMLFAGVGLLAHLLCLGLLTRRQQTDQ